MVSLRWQLFLRASSPEKANRLLDSVARAVRREITVLEGERYWKDPKLYRSVISTAMTATKPRDVIGEALELCSGIADHWLVASPQLYEGDRWEFTGTAEERTIHIPGVSFVDFQVGNLEAVSSELVKEDA